MAKRNRKSIFTGWGVVTLLALWGVLSSSSLADIGHGTVDAIVYGAGAGGVLGADLVTGDLNNDGIADLVVSAPWINCPMERPAAGAVYILFGETEWPATTDLRSQADVTICGAYEGDQLGGGDRHEAGALAIGDLNGDGFNDLVIGAANADGPEDKRGNAGNVYILLGGPDWNAMIDLATSFNGSVLYGEDKSDFFGTSVAVTNLDGDAYDDLVVGAMNADATVGRQKAGRAYVWYGRETWDTVIDTAVTGADFTVLGRTSRERLGIQVEVGDINADDAADLLVAAPDAGYAGRNWNGVVYGFFFGTRRTGVLDLAFQSPDWLAFGEFDSDRAGEHLAIGEFTGDGMNDVLISALSASVALDRPLAGKVYLLFGPAWANEERDLSTDADVVIYGAEEQDFLGDVAAGDLDRDGVDEMILGARQADLVGSPEDNHGALYILSAGSVTTPYDLATGADHMAISGQDPGDLLSRAAVGNVDDRGAGDLLAGAYGGDGPPSAPREDSGEVYLIWGTAPTPTVTPTSPITATPTPTATVSVSPTATSTPAASPSPMPTEVAGRRVYLPLVAQNWQRE